MKTRKFIIINILVALVIGTLIGVQLYWINHAFQMGERDYQRTAAETLHQVGAQVANGAGCFEMFSKLYIEPGEGIYLVKHKWKNDRYLTAGPKSIDSIPMYLKDDSLFAYNQYMFSHPFILEVSYKFRFQVKDYEKYKKGQKYFPQQFEALNPENFNQKVWDKKSITEKIDTHNLNIILSNALQKAGINDSFQLGIKSKTANKFEYLKYGSSTASLIKSGIHTDLFDDKYFSKPYELYIKLNNPASSIFKSIWSVLITSVLVIFILIYLFYYFIKTIREQKKLSEMKTAFINNMTHEFKTPLSTISLAGQALSDKRISKDQTALQRYSALIESESNRLYQHIDRILQMAVIENGQAKLNLSMINIHDVIQKAVDHFSLFPELSKGTIDCRLNANEPEIQADEVHICNILYNLIENALKYSEEKVIVDISTRNTIDGIMVLVKDQGIGINELEQEKIFESFYRVNTGNIHNVKGFGIGLSYVKKMVEEHHGRIELSSKPGEGSEFRLYFPFKQEMIYV